MEVASIIVELMEPEVETAPIVIRAFIRIPVQVAELLHQHKRRILFLAANSAFSETLRNTEPRVSSAESSRHKILALLFPRCNARISSHIGPRQNEEQCSPGSFSRCLEVCMLYSSERAWRRTFHSLKFNSSLCKIILDNGPYQL